MKPSKRINHIANEHLSKNGLSINTSFITAIMDYIDEEWEKNKSVIKQDNGCIHEPDGLSYTSNPSQSKCKKCGKFYK